MEGKYIIVDLQKKDFIQNLGGDIIYYDTKDEALNVCETYSNLKNVWVLKLIHNHIEEDGKI